MGTFMHAHIVGTPARWQEVDVLLDHAQKITGSSDSTVVDPLCRAAVVMIVAHFEGFIKDTMRVLVDDLNTHSSFSKIPRQAQRIFCRTFTGTDPDGTGEIGKEGNEREMRLVKLFENYDVKMEHEPFVGGTSNPKPSVIERLCANFGAPKFFAWLDGSKLDDVFLDDPTVTEALQSSIEAALLSGVATYPYSCNPNLFSFGGKLVQPKKPSMTKTETMWESFLNNMLFQRHQVAHGASLGNGMSIKELRAMKRKANILAYSIGYSVCAV